VDDDIRNGARAADLAKVRQARAMSPAMEFQAGSDLFAEGCRWPLASLATQFPDLEVLLDLTSALESAGVPSNSLPKPSLKRRPLRPTDPPRSPGSMSCFRIGDPAYRLPLPLWPLDRFLSPGKAWIGAFQP
jgi:hypothetical protein